jgi:hypothetical protein
VEETDAELEDSTEELSGKALVAAR